MQEESTVSASFAASSFGGTASFTGGMSTTGDILESRLERLLDAKLAEHLGQDEATRTILAHLERIADSVEALADIRRPSQHRPTSPKDPSSPKEVRAKPRRPVSSIQSLVELESAFLQEVCEIRSERRKSHVAPAEASVKFLPIAPEKNDELALPEPPESPVPGLVTSDVDDADVLPKAVLPQSAQKRPRYRHAGSTLVVMNQESQACILDSHTATHLSYQDQLANKSVLDGQWFSDSTVQ